MVTRGLVVLALSLLAAAPPAPAQPAPARGAAGPSGPGWRLEGAAGYASPLVRGERGTEVRTGVTGALGVGRSWPSGFQDRLSLLLRASASGTTVDGADASWGAGTTVGVDLTANAERTVRSRWSLGVGAGFIWLHGPSDLVPFRGAGGVHEIHPTAQLVGGARLSESGPLRLLLTVQGFRLGGAGGDDAATQAGWVVRGLAGLRYGL